MTRSQKRLLELWTELRELEAALARRGIPLPKKKPPRKRRR